MTVQSLPFSGTPSQKYSSRSNAKEIVARYGAVGNVVWTGGENALSCQIDTLNPQSTLKNNYKYMFQKATEKALGKIIKNRSLYGSSPAL